MRAAWRGILTVAASFALGACRVDPTGEDATLAVTWSIYGQAPEGGGRSGEPTDWCGVAGIHTVRMVVDGDPAPEFEWPCTWGRYESGKEVLDEGDYFVGFQALGPLGLVVASTHDGDEGDIVTVNRGDAVALEAAFDAGQRADLDVPLTFELPGDDAVGACRDAGVERVGHQFFVEDGGAWRGTGVDVYLDDGGGVECDAADRLALPDVSLGVYAVAVQAVDTSGTEWSGRCEGLVLQEEPGKPAACAIHLRP